MSFVVDFRFLELSIELDSLRDLLVTIEDQEADLAEKRLQEINKYIDSLKPDVIEEEWDILRQKYYYQIDHLYPKSFRGSFIVILWATIESALQEFASFIQTKKEIRLNFNDIRGDDFLNRIEKYITRVLDYRFLDKSALDKLKTFYILRNCYAHANGRIEAIKENDLRKLNKENEEQNFFLENQGYIIVNIEYLYDSYSFINDEIQKLMKYIKEWDDTTNAST